MDLFGFKIIRKDEEEAPLSFSAPVEDDGATVVAAGGSYGTYVDLEATAKNEGELVTRYREMSMQAECESAIDDIVNDAITTEEDEIVTINLDVVKAPENIKTRIKEEFDTIRNLLNFDNQAYEIFKRWYVDGRLHYHVIIDPKNLADGIQELRYLDPRKIKKIRQVETKKKGQLPLKKVKDEFWIYNDKGFNTKGTVAATGGDYGSTQGLKIAKDSILSITSGLTDQNNAIVLSYLHKAIKPLNQLRTLEDATVIYRISRAPERRIFYIDVGNLPKMKAEQYLRDMMARHKNRLIYDASTGEVRDDRKFQTMLEDYWLPRREGGKGTEITTLPAGQNLGELEDVKYFQKKLYTALNVPVSRLEPDTGFALGRTTEISRDEVKFSKFVSRLRKRFSQLFLRALEKQLIMKNVITPEEWPDLMHKIDFDFADDNFFTELKDSDVMKERIAVADAMQNYIGKYYSNEWIRKNIFKQTEDDIKEQDELIKAEPAELLPLPDNNPFNPNNAANQQN
jgi:hypothetical protein